MSHKAPDDQHAELLRRRRQALSRLCATFDLDVLYAFGSRAHEAGEWARGKRIDLGSSRSDVDVAAKPRAGKRLSLDEEVRLGTALEELLGVQRVDAIDLAKADAFVAANAIRGERLHARNEHLADEYDLYVLRRAGDLAYWERRRLQTILDGGRE